MSHPLLSELLTEDDQKVWFFTSFHQFISKVLEILMDVEWK
jgi:hypothetical protein